MISLANLLRHIEVKILFTTLFNSMIEESKYCSDVMKKQFNKELLKTKKDNENFKNSINVGFVTMVTLIMMLK